jgi:hypothetical protein|tara:strand:- start:78 stop:215 length:138 start_codon:yes stop_codon:yes gene_type:complete
MTIRPEVQDMMAATGLSFFEASQLQDEQEYLAEIACQLLEEDTES